MICALGTSGRWVMPWRRAPLMTRGGRPSSRSDGRPHLGQGPNHALHRPAGQGTVAAHDRLELVRGQNPGHQTHRRARVAGIERAGGCGQASRRGRRSGRSRGCRGFQASGGPSPRAPAGNRGSRGSPPPSGSLGCSSGRRRAPPAWHSGARWTCRRGPGGGRPHVRPASPGPRRLAREAFPHYNIGQWHASAQAVHARKGTQRANDGRTSGTVPLPFRTGSGLEY